MRIEDYNACIPVAITRIINEKGIKQYAVAKAAGFKPQEFNAMLNGRKIIKPCDVISISSALGISPSDLFETEKTTS